MIELLKVYSGSYFWGALGGGWRWGEGGGEKRSEGRSGKAISKLSTVRTRAGAVAW